MQEVMAEDDGKILSVFRTGSMDLLCSFEYERMLPFLRFLDKYAIKVVNGDAMRKWRAKNINKALIHNLTPADIAYATLTYENKKAVWEENLVNKKGGTNTNLAEQKYHIKKGARVKKYCDGWTDDGRQYYKELVGQYTILWEHQAFFASLIAHWCTYEHTTHTATFKRKASEARLDYSDYNDGDDDSEDEISMPGDCDMPSSDITASPESPNINE